MQTTSAVRCGAKSDDSRSKIARYTVIGASTDAKWYGRYKAKYGPGPIDR